jgi:Ti-type conjugative transfer relaxase TraA
MISWNGRPSSRGTRSNQDDLPSPDMAKQLFDGLPEQPLDQTSVKIDPAFEARRAHLVEDQRRQRNDLLRAQELRRAAEALSRQTRMPRGIKAVWAKVSGSYGRLIAEIEREAIDAVQRDRAEQEALIERHLAERRALDRQFGTEMRRDLAAVFVKATRGDPRQRLRLPKEPQPFSSAQLIRDPTLILSHLSRQKATFSVSAIKQALASMMDDPLALRGAVDAVLSSPELVRLADETYTTRDYQQAVQSLDVTAVSLARQGGFAIADRHIDAAMGEQDAQLDAGFGSRLSDEQRAAVRHILGDGSFACVVGLAGSGKSTMLSAAYAAWARQGVRVHGAALSGKAAEGLQSASGIESRTLASLEHSWQNGYEPIAVGDVLVIDEAGMIGTRQLMRVATKLHDIGAKLVLIGDPDQLQPIEAGTPFRDLVANHGSAKLTEIHRQASAWQRQASRDLADGNLQKAFDAYDLDGSVHRASERETALASLVEDYLVDHETGGAQVSRLAFAHRRRDVFALNQAIRGALRRAGAQTQEMIFETDTGPRAMAAEDRIVFTQNDRALGVKNGMLGTVDVVADGGIVVTLDGDAPRRRVTFNPEQYTSFDHGYAVTIHKSQGATVDRAWVLASRSMDAPLTYVAMTRHREALQLYIDEGDKPNWSTREQDKQIRRGPSRPLIQ